MSDAMTPQTPPPAQESAPPTQEPTSAEAEPDYVAEIERLGQLKEKGLITEEEFEAKKKQLLGL